MVQLRKYIYKGDRLTDERFKNKVCFAVLRADGKCICGRMATMLVKFESGEKAVVLRRLLRKQIL